MTRLPHGPGRVLRATRCHRAYDEASVGYAGRDGRPLVWRPVLGHPLWAD